MATINAQDAAEIRRKNQDNLKHVDSGGTIHYQQTGKLLILGDGHKPEHLAYLENPRLGTITETASEKLSPAHRRKSRRPDPRG